MSLCVMSAISHAVATKASYAATKVQFIAGVQVHRELLDLEHYRINLDRQKFKFQAMLESLK